jgi:FtsP/CotA-like multicopper oxidase with cupredoxin domain
MTAMDVSDIYYNKFLINGKNESQIEGFSAPPLSVDDFGARKFKAGDKVRLKISNGGASTYFWLRYAGGKITVVASDGNDVEPLK